MTISITPVNPSNDSAAGSVNDPANVDGQILIGTIIADGDDAVTQDFQYDPSSTEDGAISIIDNYIYYTQASSVSVGSTDNFTYNVVNTETGNASQDVIETVTFTPAPPTVQPFYGPLNVEAGHTVTLATVTAGPAGDTLALGAVTSTDGGSVSLSSSGVVTYTEVANTGQGPDHVSYTIYDVSNGTSTVETETVTVVATPAVTAAASPTTYHGAPGVTIGTLSTIGDTLSSVTLTDASGAISENADAYGGTLSVSVDGTHIIYTAGADSGVTARTLDTIHYTVTDTNGETSAVQTETVQLVPVLSDTAGSSSITVAAGSATLLDTVTGTTTGDTLVVSMQSVGADNGVVSVVSNTGAVSYTAPTLTSSSAGTASTSDTITFTITDENTGGTVTHSQTVHVDNGATLTTVSAPHAVETGQSVILGTVTPGYGESDSALTIDASSLHPGGALSLVKVDSSSTTGAEYVVYTATSTTPSAMENVTYTIDDSAVHNGSVNNGTGQSVQFDAGPSLITQAPHTVEAGQSTIVGVVTAGVSTDVLTLSPGTPVVQFHQALFSADATSLPVNDGALTLVATATAGTYNVVYTAGNEATVVGSGGSDRFSYTIEDQNYAVASADGHVVFGATASPSANQTVTLDAGPTIAAPTPTPTVVETGQTTVVGKVTPGEAGDKLTVTIVGDASSHGALALATTVNPDGSYDVTYTAPSVTTNGTDTLTYTVTDQHISASADNGNVAGQTVTSGTIVVNQDAGPTLTQVASATVYTVPATGETGASFTPGTGPAPTSVVIGHATPGEVGDVLTVAFLTKGETGSVTVSQGSGDIVYTPAVGATANTISTIDYTVTTTPAVGTSNIGDVVSSSSSVTVDVLAIANIIVPTTSLRINQSETVGSVTPAVDGTSGTPDTIGLSYTSTKGGTLELNNSTSQLVYTAATSIASNGDDVVSYTLTDSTNHTTTSGTIAVHLDASPLVTPAITTPIVEVGQKTAIASVVANPGDSLTLTYTDGAHAGNPDDSNGSLALNAANNQLIYTASNAIAVSETDTITYTLTDNTNGAVSTGAVKVILDSGPSVVTQVTPNTVEKGQQTVIGHVTPGLSGDTLTATITTQGAHGALSIVADDIVYTAPTNIATSGTDAFQYTVVDQHNDATITTSASVTLDAGPSVVTAVPAPTVEKGQSAIIGHVTMGEAGDLPVVTLTSTGNVGTVSLVPETNGSGVYDVKYTAPTSIANSTTDAVTYSIVDQHGDATVTGASTVILDAGPSAVSLVPSLVVEVGQSTIIGHVTPGEIGDTLSVTQTGGVGTVTLVAETNGSGVYDVKYTAPASIASSATDAVTYSIVDQHGGATVTGASSVILDAGPALTALDPSVVEKGQQTIIGHVIVGETVDIPNVTLTSTGNVGTVTLVEEGSTSTYDVTYTAPTSIASSTTDGVTYSIKDQHNDAVVTGAATVTLDAGPSVVTAAQPAVVEAGQTTVIGQVTPGEAGDVLTATITSAGAHGTLSVVAHGAIDNIIYTAPASVVTSGTDNFTYSVIDGHTDASVTGTASMNLDAGPSAVTAVTPSVIESGQTTVIGQFVVGEAGDTPTVTLISTSAGTVSLAEVNQSTTYNVVYTAPTNITSSTADSVVYSIVDQHDGATVTSSSIVTLDAGPSLVTPVTPLVVEASQSTIIGYVTPGEVGDTLSVALHEGSVGTVSLVAETNGSGVYDVTYTAPTSVVSSTMDTVSYSIDDNHNVASVTGSATVTLDAGPSVVTAIAPTVVEAGQTTIIGHVTPGEAGDTLTGIVTSGTGSISFQPDANLTGVQDVVFTAPATISASGAETITYTITDQHNGVSSGDSTIITLGVAPTVTSETATVVSGGAVTGLSGAALLGDSAFDNTAITVTSVCGQAPGGAVDGRYGQLTLNSDGSYTYVTGVTQAETYHLLTSGDGTATDTFSYTVTDIYGGATSSTLAVTINLTAESVESLTDTFGGGVYSIGASTLTLNQDTATTYCGVIQDGSSGNVGGNINVIDVAGDGTGVLTLTGANTFTGHLRVSGELVLGSGGSVSDAYNVGLKAAGAVFDVSATGCTSIGNLNGSGGFVDLGGSTLVVNQITAATFSGVIQDADLAQDGAAGGSLVVAGSAELTLNGANTFTGSTTIAGELGLGAHGSLASTVQLLGAGAVFDVSATGVASISTLSGEAGSLIDLGASTLRINEQTAQTFAGVIQDADLAGDGAHGGYLVVNGPAALTLTGANTFSGHLQLYSELDLGLGGSVSDAFNVGLKGPNAVFDISATGGTSIGNLNGSAGVVDLGASTLTINQTTAASFAGVIQNQAPFINDRLHAVVLGGGLVVGGTAELTLNGANTFTGSTTITGELGLGAHGSLVSAVQLTASGAVFDVSATGGTSIGTLSGESGSFLDLGASRLTINEQTAQTFAGVIQDADLAGDGANGGYLVVSGPAALTLTGTNTFTGHLQVYGELDLGVGGSVSDAFNVGLKASGAVFDVSATGGTSIGNLNGSAGVVDLGASTLTIDQTTAASFAGVIQDGSHGTGGALVLDGSAMLTLSGGNTFTGGVTLQSGGLELAAAGAAGSHFITFASEGGGPAELQIDAAALSGPVGHQHLGTGLMGFASNDTIDLSSLAYTAGASATFTNGLLEVSNGVSTITLTISGIASDTSFMAFDDSHGHVQISEVHSTTTHPDLFHG